MRLCGASTFVADHTMRAPRAFRLLWTEMFCLRDEALETHRATATANQGLS